MKIKHIVVLARNKITKEYFHYQCSSSSDIQSSSYPIKIFINYFDFTQKLTTKTRLTSVSLKYILDNIHQMTFRNILRHFKEVYSEHRMRRYLRSTKNKHISECPIVKRHGLGFKSENQLPLPKKTFVKGETLQPVTSTYTATPYDYGATELTMKEAQVKKRFTRGFLSYLQVVGDKRFDARDRFVLHFDHSIFSYLIDTGLDSEDELITVVEKIFETTHYPTYEDLERILRTMEHQNKIDILGSRATVESVICAFDDYFQNLKASARL